MRIQRGSGMTINERRRRIAEAEARSFIGVVYSVLALHLDPVTLKKAADWRGIIQSLGISFRRYADGEAQALLQRKTSL